MNRRLLVIDDESSIRMFLRDIFESKGCSITVAASGRDGLRFAKAERLSVLSVRSRSFVAASPEVKLRRFSVNAASDAGTGPAPKFHASGLEKLRLDGEV